MPRARSVRRRADDDSDDDDWESDSTSEDLPDWTETDESHLEDLQRELRAQPRTRRDVRQYPDLVRHCHFRPLVALERPLQIRILSKLKHLEDSISFVEEALQQPKRLHVLLWLDPVGSHQEASSPPGEDEALSQLLDANELRRTRLTPSKRRPGAQGPDPKAEAGAKGSAALPAASPEPHLLGFCVLSRLREPTSGAVFNVIEYFETLCNGSNLGQLMYERAGELMCRSDAAAAAAAEAAADASSRNTTKKAGLQRARMPPASAADLACTAQGTLSYDSGGGRSQRRQPAAAAATVGPLAASAPAKSLPQGAPPGPPPPPQPPPLHPPSSSLASWPLPSAPTNIYYWMKMERIPALGHGGLLRVFVKGWLQGLGRAAGSRHPRAGGGAVDIVSSGETGGRREQRQAVRVAAAPGAVAQGPAARVQRRRAGGAGRAPGASAPLTESAAAAAAGGASGTASFVLAAFRSFFVEKLHWEAVEVEAYLREGGGEAAVAAALLSLGEQGDGACDTAAGTAAAVRAAATSSSAAAALVVKVDAETAPRQTEPPVPSPTEQRQWRRQRRRQPLPPPQALGVSQVRAAAAARCDCSTANRSRCTAMLSGSAAGAGRVQAGSTPRALGGLPLLRSRFRSCCHACRTIRSSSSAGRLVVLGAIPRPALCRRPELRLSASMRPPGFERYEGGDASMRRNGSLGAASQARKVTPRPAATRGSFVVGRTAANGFGVAVVRRWL